MPIIVDDLRGSIHKKYGKLPNPTFLIDKSGRIAFRCLWTQPAVVAPTPNAALSASCCRRSRVRDAPIARRSASSC